MMNAEAVAGALRLLVVDARKVARECEGALGPVDVEQLLAQVESLACELEVVEHERQVESGDAPASFAGLWDALFAARFERLAWIDREMPVLGSPAGQRALAEACARFADLGVELESRRALEGLEGGDDGF